jgi:DNA-binding NarL/FixJ family response regulator
VALRVIVADDDPGFLREFISLLGAEFEVVATASDGESALEYIRQHRPDVAVLDLKMPKLNGIEITRKATCCMPGLAVVICSVENHSDMVEVAFEAGALGYVSKTRIASDLISAVKSTAAGRRFISVV